jgi:hypothetical protein
VRWCEVYAVYCTVEHKLYKFKLYKRCLFVGREICEVYIVQCNLYTNSCINFINKHVSTYLKLALYPLMLFHQQTIIYC